MQQQYTSLEAVIAQRVRLAVLAERWADAISDLRRILAEYSGIEEDRNVSAFLNRVLTAVDDLEASSPPEPPISE